MYQRLLRDERFNQLYEPVQSHIKPCPNGGSGLWIRKDMLKDSSSHERKLMMTLQSNIIWGVLETERDRCMTETQKDCHYIDRAIYRFTPELMSQYPEHVDEIQQVVQRLWNP